MRNWVRAVGAAITIGGPAALAFFSGGFFDRPRLVAGITAWALVVGIALVAARPLPASAAGRVALGGLFLLTAWTALSLIWAPLGARAQDDLQRLLLYLGFFTAALALLRGPGVRRWLEPAVALGTLVVVGYGLSERLLPGLIELDRSRSAAGRLEQPLSYWNALGMVAALGLVLSVRIAGDPRRPRAVRASAAAAGVPLGLGVYLSFSRAALAAVAVGVLVLLALAPQGRPQLRGAIAIIGAATAAALVASRLPTVQSLDVGERGDSSEGLLMLAALAVLAVVGAALAVRRPRRRIAIPPLPVSRRRAVLLVTVIALLAGGITGAALEGAPQGVSPERGADPARLKSLDTNRYAYWDAAVQAWADHPLIGMGSGGFLVEWLKVDTRVDQSGDAHSLYLETAAELGVVGFVLLVLFLGGAGAGAVRLARQDTAAATGIAAGMAAWALHAGLDWDWEMPAVTLMALLLAAAGIAWSEERGVGPTARRRQTAGAGAAAGGVPEASPVQSSIW
jgi:O-Antigen ligase